MKRDFNLWTSGLVPWTLGLGPFSVCYPLFSLLLLMAASSAFAFTSENNSPYTGIVERNVFGIKAPPPPQVAAPPPTAATGVQLRGITTLLGRPQVLLNFTIPGKPPEPAKERSMVMAVNDREGEVEVLEINPATGSVRLRNQGNELSLNLKDNAAKPQSIPGLAAPTMPPPAGINPGFSSPGGVPAPAAAPLGGSTAPAASLPARPAMPSRNLRSSSNPATTQATAQDNAFRETQVALIEVEREVHKNNPKYPPPPPTPITPNP